MTEPVLIQGLHPFEYEHPFDAMALDALQQTPGLDVVVRQFVKHAVERTITVQYTGSHLRVTGEDYPDLQRVLETTCRVVNLTELPSFYVEIAYEINGFTIGVDHPIIVVTSGSVDHLNDRELMFLLGHEVGHIKSRHTLYHQMATFFPLLANFLGQATLGVGKLLATPVEAALLNWMRMSELTADRAGLLSCQDLDCAVQVMMKWAGLPRKYYQAIDPAAFIRQAREFEKLDYDKINKAVKFFAIWSNTHPWTVVRTAELLRWVEDGEYERVIARETQSRVFKRYVGAQASCRKCGYRLSGSEKFCPSCGTSFLGRQEGNSGEKRDMANLAGIEGDVPNA